MKTIIGIVLILASVFLGYKGIQQWNESSKSIEIGKLELSAHKQTGMNTAYLYLGGAVAALVAGIFAVKKS